MDAWDRIDVLVNNAGTDGIGSSVAYAASKGALNTMTMSLARALAPTVRVNAVCPGFVATRWFTNEFGKEAGERMASEHKKTVPLDRVADAADIADVALFFAGRATSRARLCSPTEDRISLSVPPASVSSRNESIRGAHLGGSMPIG